MAKFLGMSMSPRQVMASKIVMAGLVGAALVTGCNYVATTGAEFVRSPRESIVRTVDSAAMNLDPGIYLNVASQYMAENKENMSKYQADVSNLVKTTDENDLLTAEDRLNLFKSNAQKVPVEDGIRISEQYVLARATPERQLEHILAGVKGTDINNYGQVLGAMAENVGSELQQKIQEIIPW